MRPHRVFRLLGGNPPLHAVVLAERVPFAAPSREQATERFCASSPGHVASATGEGRALRSAEEREAVGIAGTGAISSGQKQVCLLSPKPGIRSAEFSLRAKPRAVFCAKTRRGFQNSFIAHCFPSWAPMYDFCNREEMLCLPFLGAALQTLSDTSRKTR